MAIQLQHKLFSTDEYHAMIKSGVFAEDDRLELIDGEIFTMSPIGPTHAGRVNRLNRFFVQRFGDRALVSIQNPIWLGPHSEPQPDVAVLRWRDDDYTESHPTADDVLLLVEVSESSADYDRNVKVPLYARSGVLEAWLIALDSKWIEVYAEPSPVGYRVMRRVLPGESLAPKALPDALLLVDDILK
jgi:Uma2 family endonuclease